MLKFTLLFALMLAQQPQELDFAGQIVSAAKEPFRWVQVESIDHHFVEYCKLDAYGRFFFKKIPEGMYKLIIQAGGGREERRTVEIRSAFADSQGRVAFNVELQDDGRFADEFKVDAASLAISPKAESELRKSYQARGDVAKVTLHLEKAIAIAPNFATALNNLGAIYFTEQQYDKARELFERALHANPNMFSAQLNLGGVLIELGDDQSALTENLKAVEMRPSDSGAQAQLGLALFDLKRYDLALEHLQIAKSIDPMSFTLPGLFMARIYAVRGQTAMAVAEYKEFLGIHAGNAVYTDSVERELSLIEKR